LIPFLVDKKAALAITGKGQFNMCSEDCLEEEEDKWDQGEYNLIDAGRFNLSFCNHASHHL